MAEVVVWGAAGARTTNGSSAYYINTWTAIASQSHQNQGEGALLVYLLQAAKEGSFVGIK